MTLMIPRVRLKPDAFLYECYAADNARHRRNGTFNSHLRFEPFLLDSYARPASPDVRTLKEEIAAVLEHHHAVIPHFRRNEDVDLENIAYFTLSISTIFADLSSLFRAYTGQELPKIPSHDTEYSDGFPELVRVIGAHTAYLGGAADQGDEAGGEREPFDPFAVDEHTSLADLNVQKAEFAAEIWDLVSERIFEIFPDHAAAIMSFASWKFKLEEPAEEIDWRARPPVGELFAKAFRMRSGPRAGASFGSGGRGGDRRGGAGTRGPGGPGGRGPRLDRGDRPESGEREEYKAAPLPGSAVAAERAGRAAAESGSERGAERGAERAPREDRPDGAPRGERPDRGDRGDRSDRGDRGRRGGRDRSEGSAPLISTDDDLQPWLEEARAAMDRLKADPQLPEVRLAPSNSFIRRQQHSLLTEQGFETESRGEGRERCIYVRQKG